jgi:hypothetical protein
MRSHIIIGAETAGGVIAARLSENASMKLMRYKRRSARGSLLADQRTRVARAFLADGQSVYGLLAGPARGQAGRPAVTDNMRRTSLTLAADMSRVRSSPSSPIRWTATDRADTRTMPPRSRIRDSRHPAGGGHSTDFASNMGGRWRSDIKPASGLRHTCRSDTASTHPVDPVDLDPSQSGLSGASMTSAMSPVDQPPRLPAPGPSPANTCVRRT